MKKVIADRVNDLPTEGKTYDLSYNGKFVANVTLEVGVEMTQERGLAIINDLLASAGVKPRKYADRVSFEEC